jgi:C-terminal processing protease CtpA/Prc
MLATPANIAAWERLLPEAAERDQKRIRERVERMKAATSEWVPMSNPSIVVTHYTKEQVKASPESVWIMIGPKCGSSCEQFVLVARQNPRVTLVGRKTYGALDASNVRPIEAPSGEIALYYATTYVHRPNGEAIDNVGISPAVELAPPADDAAYAAEITTVQRLAEEGRDASSKEKP